MCHVNVADSLIQASLLGEAVDNGPAAVFVADETRRYIAVNRAACDLLGYSREELLQLSIEDVSANREHWNEMLQGTITGSVDVVRKDGTQLTLRYVAGRTLVAGMPVFVSVGVAG